jgi:hypothetical protein
MKFKFLEGQALDFSHERALFLGIEEVRMISKAVRQPGLDVEQAQLVSHRACVQSEFGPGLVPVLPLRNSWLAVTVPLALPRAPYPIGLRGDEWAHGWHPLASQTSEG